jgi:hypothetical protein
MIACFSTKPYQMQGLTPNEIIGQHVELLKIGQDGEVLVAN